MNRIKKIIESYAFNLVIAIFSAIYELSIGGIIICGICGFDNVAIFFLKMFFITVIPFFCSIYFHWGFMGDVLKNHGRKHRVKYTFTKKKKRKLGALIENQNKNSTSIETLFSVFFDSISNAREDIVIDVENGKIYLNRTIVAQNESEDNRETLTMTEISIDQFKTFLDCEIIRCQDLCNTSSSEKTSSEPLLKRIETLEVLRNLNAKNYKSVIKEYNSKK